MSEGDQRVAIVDEHMRLGNAHDLRAGSAAFGPPRGSRLLP